MITAKELLNQLKHLETIQDLDQVGVILSSCHCDDHECEEGLNLIDDSSSTYWKNHRPDLFTFIKLD